jgi:predicted secreted protein
MRKTMFLILAVLVSAALASAPDTLWTRTYGGASDDVGRSMELTPDGGCIIAGYTRSFGAGGSDVWLLKVDAQGDTEWTRTYGGSADDEAYSVDLTFDGGYIVAGMTKSLGAGGSDVWLLKVTASGDTEWTRTLGGAGDEYGSSVQQTADSGHVIAGRAGGAYLAKTNLLGDSLWTRAYPIGTAAAASAVRQAAGRGFFVGGREDDPYWGGLLLRVDSVGDTLWCRRGGGSGDCINGLVLRPDNGCIVVGCIPACKVVPIFLNAYDSLGSASWGRVYYPPSGEARGGNSVERAGNGYIAAGGSSSGADDVFLVRVNLAGDSLWAKVIGGDSEDIGYSCQQTGDSGFVVAGCTRSFGAGGADVWLIRLEPERIGIEETPSAKRQTTNAGATVMRRLPIGAVVFDAMGRRAANPKPGVYFVREAQAQAQAQAVRKIVVTK